MQVTNRRVDTECDQEFNTDSKVCLNKNVRIELILIGLYFQPIRFSGLCNDDEEQQMSGTFVTNDSDAEDSNSSEEFVYAKGSSQILEYLRSTQNPVFQQDQYNEVPNESTASLECSQESIDEKMNTQDIWNFHEDLIDVSTKGRSNYYEFNFSFSRQIKQVCHSLLRATTSSVFKRILSRLIHLIFTFNFFLKLKLIQLTTY